VVIVVVDVDLVDDLGHAGYLRALRDGRRLHTGRVVTPRIVPRQAAP